MRTLRLTIAYEGTRYAGWQIQARPIRHSIFGIRHSTRPTVQGTLERVLRRIVQEPVRVIGSGRTDAGVHALAQVAHVKTQSAISCERLRRSLNQLLPSDIAVTGVEDVEPTFHARFAARSKHYRYRIATGAVVSPFARRYVHHVPVPLKTALMRREAAGLRGRHQFGSFARQEGGGKPTDRTITHVALRRRNDELHLDLEGNGFLHTMVRSIAGTLIDIGRGRLPPGTIQRLLHHPAREHVGTTAPARGLTLVGVSYEE